MSAPSWEARLKGEHPNLHQLYLGEPPDSYAAVIADVKALLDQYVAADLEGTKPIKAALFQAGAHLNLLATGTATGADISAEDFQKKLRSMADEAMKAINRGVHATAVQHGLDRKLDLPKVPKKTPLQDQFCKYLTSGFQKKVKSTWLEERFAQLDADEVLVTVMLLHAAYVDAKLRGDTTLAQLIPGFLAPDDKDFLRAMVKLLGDYFDKKIPAAHLLDIVRFCVGATFHVASSFTCFRDPLICAGLSASVLVFSLCFIGPPFWYWHAGAARDSHPPTGRAEVRQDPEVRADPDEGDPYRRHCRHQVRQPRRGEGCCLLFKMVHYV